jgi:hypothetical protein
MEAQVTAVEHRLSEVCGHLNVLHAQLVDLVAEALVDGLWEQAGIRSPEHWLTWKAGVSAHTARQIVTIARRIAHLPANGELFAHGELSVDQMAVVAEHTREAHDAQVAAIAPFATVRQLRVALGRSRPYDDPSALDVGAAPAELPDDRVGFGYDHRNRFVLHADLSAEIGAHVEQALREARDHAFHQSGGDRVTWVDALTTIADRSLATTDSSSRRDRYRVYLHVDTEGGWLQQGPALPPAVVEQIICDGTVHPVWFTGGRPMNVGRARRTFPNHTRRLILDRDRHCTAPGCHNSVGLEVHHIIHWTKGGPTTTANGITLCSRHHHALHHGQLHVSGNADLPKTLAFTDQRGRPIRGACPQPPDRPPPSPPPGHHYAHPTGEPFDTRWFHLHDPPVAAA